MILNWDWYFPKMKKWEFLLFLKRVQHVDTPVDRTLVGKKMPAGSAMADSHFTNGDQ
jgi:hypothetical protein